jgi:hypothetical protein
VKSKVSLSIAFLLAALGCRGSSPAPAPAPTAPAEPTPAATPAPPAFQPPADGRLTAAQVEMYIEVQKKTRELADPTRAAAAPATQPAEIAALAIADVRAAEQLGHDPDEYRWVQERIAEARPARSAGPSLPPEVLKAVMRGAQAVREQAAAPSAPPRSAVAANRKLLQGYRAELDQLAGGGRNEKPANKPS